MVYKIDTLLFEEGKSNDKLSVIVDGEVLLVKSKNNEFFKDLEVKMDPSR